MGCALGYLQSGVKLRTQKGGHAKKKTKKKGGDLLPSSWSRGEPGTGKRGASALGGGRVGDMGEWSVREIGEVRGFGGSTGCPECKVVSIGKKAEKECQCPIFYFHQ